MKWVKWGLIFSFGLIAGLLLSGLFGNAFNFL
ncbi:hypothetical protein DFR63_1173 [Jeotgalicoccus halotolerans]|uniref:Uncharacterized protein n=1 Tax=Jeotgalicoccus halotolerans TaxID=157227 RepID=A0A3E0AYM6_9STAP|nr:hypothetical protein DFR63_1173 [Jeotgalicoccus halotolerans]